MTDEEALTAWIDGSEAAGRALIERHYERILLFFFSKVAPDVARDLTQATFETLCQKKVEFRGDSSVLTYVFGIARWKLVHHFRNVSKQRQRFDPLEESAEVPDVEASINALFIGRQEETLLVRALRSLPLDDQIILELKEYEGLSSRELAEMYDVGREAMSSRVTRARRRLAASVERLSKSARLIDSTLTGLDAHMRKIREAVRGLAHS